MTETDKKPVGRPRKYAGKRPTWTIRLEPEIGEWVKETAAITGRSISEVCESLIVKARYADRESKLLKADIDRLQKKQMLLEVELREIEMTSAQAKKALRDAEKFKRSELVKTLEETLRRVIKETKA